jgi:hypothetical protein
VNDPLLSPDIMTDLFDIDLRCIDLSAPRTREEMLELMMLDDVIEDKWEFPAVKFAEATIAVWQR